MNKDLISNLKVALASFGLATIMFAFSMVVPTAVVLWVVRTHPSLEAEPYFRAMILAARSLFCLVLIAILIFDLRQKDFRRSLFYTLGVAIGFMMLISFEFSCLTLYEYSHRRQFDSTVWKNSTDRTKEPARVEMVDDLRKRYKLVGMSRAQILELLGPPSEDSSNSPDRIIYWLGPERAFISIDDEWLLIRFDKDRVVSVQNIAIRRPVLTRGGT